jgi:lipid-binding SYLF domain-containing protein
LVVEALIYEGKFFNKGDHSMSKMRLIRLERYILFLTLSAALPVMGADDTAKRLENAVDVVNTMTESEHGIRPEQLAAADCLVVIPGFKKGAAVIGVGVGRGFISCRNDAGWSAPGAIALESGSLGVQIGGEKIDIVILSLDKERRSKLLSDRFAIGSDASAAWGNGKSAHDDPNAKILFFGRTKGIFGGFGLDGATLKPDESANRALYGKAITNTEIVGGGVEAPAVAQPLIVRLAR